ncbi:MAG: histidine kinase [Bacteroidales bacterium]|nr:histidine kinase [Bacteroidales bacterium]
MMALFETQVKAEFRKLERLVKFIAIPFFTLLTVIFLTPWPFHLENKHMIMHVLFSFSGVAGAWLIIRGIIYVFRKYLPGMRFWIRLALQLILSSLGAILISWLLYTLGDILLEDHIDLCNEFDIAEESKNLYVTSVLFAFLINIIYESFYLFIKLSEKAVETERYKKKSIEAQYQNLTSRLNPHFLFNSLNTLTTVVEEDPKKAVEYIRELSTVYRYVLNSQKITWVLLDVEMKFAQSYVMLLKMRFEDNLQINIEICEKYLQYHILAMTVQLLIENAVKHNEISEKFPLEIRIFCKDDHLVVSNNRQKRTIMPEATTKVGLSNICERYRFLVSREVIVSEQEGHFIVKIPLLKSVEGIQDQTEEI